MNFTDPSCASLPGWIFFKGTMKKTSLRFLLTLLALVAVGQIHAAQASNPNVVIILVDDMGYGDASCFNPESKIPTPHINRLADEGLRFRDAHAPGPLCHMSRYGLMTGRFPFRTDVNKWPKQPLIDDNQVTVPSLLRDYGYHTAMVGKWHLGFRENGYDKPLPGGPADRGFHSYFGIRASTDIPPYFYIRGSRAVQPPTDRIDARNTEGWTKIQGEFWRAGGIAPNLKLHDVLPRFTQEAVKEIDDHAANRADQPLMLYLAYPAPHTPWLPTDEFKGKSGASMFGDFMMMVDDEIGKVLGALDKNKMTKDTLVIFTSDNGPVWYDEDVKRFNHDSSGGLRGMKGDAWEAGHRMPFIVRWPGVVKPGSETGRLISFTDVLATCADLVGAKLGENDGPDSFSFMPTLKGKQQEPRAPIVMKVPANMHIRDGDWKLIDALGSGGFSSPKKVKPVPGGPKGQLYNMAADPAESTNLYLKHPEIVKQLEAKMKTIIDSGRSRP